MILLDTHTFIWWLTEAEPLPSRVVKAIEKAKEKGELHVSAITFWEIAMLSAKGRMKLAFDLETWFQKTTSLPFLKIVPTDAWVYWRSVLLPPPFHADPADRIIVATAQVLGATLLTKDHKILSYPHVQTLWE